MQGESNSFKENLIRLLILWVCLSSLCANVFTAASAAGSSAEGKGDSATTGGSAIGSTQPSKGNPAAELKEAERLAASGALYQARELLGTIVRKYPDDPEVNLVAAKLYRQLGFTQQSIQYYQRVRRWRPLDIEPLVALSQMHLELLDSDNALWLARMAVNLDPRAKEARLALGEALLAAQSLKDVDTVVQSLMKEFPGDAQVLYLAYRMHRDDGDFAAARLSLELAIAMDKAQLRWLLDLSDACVADGDYKAAKKALLQYLAVEPESTEALGKYAELLEHNLHDYFGAIDEYRAMLKLDPVNVTALTGIERCRAKQNDIAAVWRDWVRNVFSFLFGGRSSSR